MRMMKPLVFADNARCWDSAGGSFYYHPVAVSAEEVWLMRQIDEAYTQSPFYGSRRIPVQLNRQYGQQWNRKRIQRLMRLMGIQGVAPRPDTSKPHPEHRIYPYLLRGLAIERVNQVWSTDVTFIPMPKGFMYLVADIDWYSRYVLAWALSNMQEDALLSGRITPGPVVQYPGNLQYGSGNSIYQPGIYSNAARPSYPDQHGWTWTRIRQYFC